MIIKSIGLIAVSGKPITAGHWFLIERSAAENNLTKVFISTANRKRKEEISIYGSDMQNIWESFLRPILPEQSEIEFCINPIKCVYKFIDENKQSNFKIYSDPLDMNKNFGKMDKYFPNKQIELITIPRESSYQISGTVMREFLKNGNQNSFIEGLPKKLSEQAKKEIWNILINRVKNENLIRSYIQMNG